MRFKRLSTSCTVRPAHYQVSSLFETAAIEYTRQADFLNCALEAETELLPMRLLQRVASIERQLGRKRIIAEGSAYDRYRHPAAWARSHRYASTTDPAPQDDGTPLRARTVGGDCAGSPSSGSPAHDSRTARRGPQPACRQTSVVPASPSELKAGTSAASKRSYYASREPQSKIRRIGGLPFFLRPLDVCTKRADDRLMIVRQVLEDAVFIGDVAGVFLQSRES